MDGPFGEPGLPCPFDLIHHFLLLLLVVNIGGLVADTTLVIQ